MIAAARRFSYDILSQVDDRAAYSNLALQSTYRKVRLAQRDRALCTAIVHGTLQRRRSLDALLAPHCSRELAALDKQVLRILRMAAFQLLFLDKVPDHAAINDAVQLCKQVRPGAQGLVNAVLRALVRDAAPVDLRLQRIAAAAATWADQAGLFYSYPTWLVERWERRFGRDRTTAMLESSNQPPTLSLRVNCLRADRSAVLADIATRFGADAALPSQVSQAGIRFRRGFDVSEWEPYHAGAVSVQDEAAMLIAPLLRPTAQDRVIDLCAAPGTKTTHIAELQGDRGYIAAIDVHEHKIPLIDAAARRLGLTSIHAEAADARTLLQQADQAERYDAALVDAPCSGFGVLRRRPEIRWQRTAADVDKLAVLQRQLLLAAAGLVRPGGVLVYSTCTLFTEENEDVVADIADRCGLVPDDLGPELPTALHGQARLEGLCLTPDQFGTDGFYMARLHKPDRAR